MRIEWTEPALRALQALHDYIARDTPFYAAQFVDRLTASAEKLQEFPDLEREVPEVGRPEIRELVFQGYRIIYRRLADRLQILVVVHGSRDLRRIRPLPWDVG